VNNPALRIAVAALVAGGVVAGIWALTRSSEPGPRTVPSASPTEIEVTETPRPSPTKTRQHGNPCQEGLTRLRSFNGRLASIVRHINQVADDHPEDVSEHQYRATADALERVGGQVDSLHVPAQLRSLQQLEATLAQGGAQAYNGAADLVHSGNESQLGNIFAQGDSLFAAVDFALSQTSC
jgi:hypothetical protein